jgi:hypothetical protein
MIETPSNTGINDRSLFTIFFPCPPPPDLQLGLLYLTFA